MESYFVRDGDLIVPTSFSAGHWAADSIAGRAVLGLSSWAFEQALPGPEWLPARLTLDMVHMGSLEPIALTTSVRRTGRTVHVVDVELVQAGRVIGLVRGVATRADQVPPGQVWSRSGTLGEPPYAELDRPGTFPMAMATGRLGDREHAGVECRAGVGAFGLTDGGAPVTWVREYVPLVAGEELTAYTRLGLGADVANSVLNWGTEGLQLINPDLTLSIARLPRGEALALESLDHLRTTGTSVGAAALHDEVGAFGVVTMTSVHQPIFSGVGTR
ncbi:MAG: acyl-CoA thioesterase domain-containing protein [Nocardioides sp.]|uniref:acyl-CoA thioesterase domain-containing protein n=1 Tax=Nocardioides sp. TaxID=35761 RepID=UPI003F00C5E2